MSSFQVKVRAIVPNETQENGVIVRFKPLTLSGIVLSSKKKFTLDDAGKAAVENVRKHFAKEHPNARIEVMKVTKLKEDFIFKIE